MTRAAGRQTVLVFGEGRALAEGTIWAPHEQEKPDVPVVQAAVEFTASVVLVHKGNECSEDSSYE